MKRIIALTAIALSLGGCVTRTVYTPTPTVWSERPYYWHPLPPVRPVYYPTPYHPYRWR